MIVIRRTEGDIGTCRTAFAGAILLRFRLADFAEILGQLRLQIQ